MPALLVKTRSLQSNETGALFLQSKDLIKATLGKITLNAGVFVLATPQLFSTAPAVTPEINHDSMRNTVSSISERVQLTQEIDTFLNRFEERVFAYPATVVDIEKNISGNAKNVVISVSIHGKSHVVKKSISQLNFDVHSNMPLVVEGIKRGSAKKLNIKKAEPVSLSHEDLELLKSL